MYQICLNFYLGFVHILANLNQTLIQIIVQIIVQIFGLNLVQILVQNSTNSHIPFTSRKPTKKKTKNVNNSFSTCSKKLVVLACPNLRQYIDLYIQPCVKNTT